MRRSHLAFLAAVSVTALLGASAVSHAVQPPKMNLGLLKPQEDWKVGTVTGKGGADYCAMVGKFDKQVVLAVAKSPEGFGSIALDFRERFFKPGEEYEVGLKVDDTRMRKLVGRASTDRSVVVQVGQDDAFFKALAANGSLAIGMPTIDVSFSMRKFSTSYKDLASCSDQLEETIPVVEKAALSPLDAEVEKIAAEKAQQVAVVTEAETLSATLEKKTGGIDKMEAELAAEAKLEQQRAQEKIAQLEEKMRLLNEKISANEKQIGSIGEQQQESERKLIAAIQTPVAVAPVAVATPSAAIAAQAIDAREVEDARVALAAVEAERAAAIAHKELQARAARLEAEKAKEAERLIAEFRQRQDKLAKEVAAAEVARNARAEKLAAAPGERSLKAGVVAKQAEISSLQSQRSDAAEKLTRKLAQAEEDYLARVAELEAERDQLKQQVGVMAAKLDQQTEPAADAGESDKMASELAAQLAIAEKEKAVMGARIDALEKQTKLMEAVAMSAKAEGDKKVDVERLQADHTSAMQALKKQLDDRTEQYDKLKHEFDVQQTQLALQEADMQKTSATKLEVAANLAAKHDEIESLKEQLKIASAAKEAETARLMRVQTEFDAARAEIAQLRAGLDAEQKRLAALKETLDRRKVDLDAVAASQSAEAKRLTAEREKLAQDKLAAGAAAAKAENDVIAALKAEIARKDEELAIKSKDIASNEALATEIARLKAELTAKAEVAKAEISASAAAEIAALKEEIARKDAELVLHSKETGSAEALATEIARLKAELTAKDGAAKAEISASAAAEIAALKEEIARKDAELAAKSKEAGSVEALAAEVARLKAELDKKDVAITRQKSSAADVPAVVEKQEPSLVMAEMPVISPALLPVPLPAPGVVAEITPDVMPAPAAAPVAPVARQEIASISEQNKMDLIEEGLLASERAELEAARRRIADLERRAQQPIESVRAQQPFETVQAPVQAVAEDLTSVPFADKPMVAAQQHGMQPQLLAGSPVLRALRMQGDDGEQARLAAENEAISRKIIDNTFESAAIEPAAAPTPVAEDKIEFVTSPVAETVAAMPSELAAVAAPAVIIPRPQPQALPAPEPVAAAPQPAKKKSIFGLGYSGQSMPQVEDEEVAVDEVQDHRLYEGQKTAVEYVPSALAPRPVEDILPPKSVMMPSEVRATKNRAAAFLDKVMSHHRPGVKPAADLRESARELPQENVTARVLGTSASDAPSGLSAIETAAGNARAATMPVRAAKQAVATLPPVTIDALLQKAGITGAVVQKQPEDGIAAWQAQGVSGMYETGATSAGSLDAEMEAYIARYREDCPNDMKVSTGAAETTPAGTMAVADITCMASGNAYTTSFVFLENAGGFSAVLHTGYPEDAAKVRSISDNIAYTLANTGGIRPVAAARSAAVQEKSAGEKLKFRINIDAPASSMPAATGEMDDFETVVVQ